jgi:hypothetical protein
MLPAVAAVLIFNSASQILWHLILKKILISLHIYLQSSKVNLHSPQIFTATLAKTPLLD